MALGERLLRYRNRDIYFSDIEFIKEAIVSFGHLGRKILSIKLCELWGWRRADGGLKDCACRDLLLRLEERGYIRLPAPMTGGARRRKSQGLPPPTPQTPIESGDLKKLIVRPIFPNERLHWRYLIEHHHYLGDRVIVGEHLLYLALLENKIVGCIGWGSAALRVPVRDEFIGWNFETKSQRLQFIANNVRFLILPHVRIKNLASRILSLNLKRLSRDWESRYKHPVHMAETFVDVERFRGTIYLASNWKRLGLTSGKSKKGNEYKKHGQKKAVFVFPLHKRANLLLGKGVSRNPCQK